MSEVGPGWAGRTIGSRYKIESLLGRGGMSSVYKAFDPNLQRAVAVKIIHPHLTDKPEFIKRFEQEAAAVAQLRHGNIVQVHDFNNDSGHYYMVMEYVPGETLANKLEALNKAGLRMPLPETIRILSTVCEAIDYAHQRRMIHRDLKPANVMIDLLGEPILMDFGIAKILGGHVHTNSGAAVGTAIYMSPEQVQGEIIDHRADIYSLGIMLYEMLSGKPPFQGDSTYQIMLKHVNEPVPDIRTIDANTPSTLAAILEKALSKDRNRRYQTAAEMAAALRTVGLQMQSPFDTLAARHLDRLSTLWQRTRDLFEEGNLAGCIDKLDELKRADPDYQREKVNQLRQEALQRLHQRAVRLLQAGKFSESLIVLGALRKRSPDHHDIDQVEAMAHQGLRDRALRQKLDRLYEEALSFLGERAYEQALDKWRAIRDQQEHFTYADRLQVEQRAREGICANLYSQAVTALSQRKPDQALALLEQVQAVDANYPDGQQVESRAHFLIHQQGKRRLWVVRLGSVVSGVMVLGLLIFLFMRVDLPADPALAIDVTVAPTIAQTIILAPTTTLPPIVLATASAEPSPTGMAVASETVAPAATATETDDLAYVATVLEPSSIFLAPNSSSPELAVVSAGEKLSIWGRSENARWLYVRNGDNINGFIFIPRVQWAGNVSFLPVVGPATTQVDATRTPAGTQPISRLELDLWVLAESGRCAGDRWHQTVFIQGRGGNGSYTYYWNDRQVSAPRNTSFVFEVVGEGDNLIGSGRAVSGDASLARQLFIPRPNCNN